MKVIYIRLPTRQERTKKEQKNSLVQVGFELGRCDYKANYLPTELNSPIHIITRKAKKRFRPFAITTFNWKFDHVPDID